MSRKLSSTDWQNATHAYGPATDVPRHLADLGSSDPRVRAAAIEALAMSINHQGSVYPASLLALPELMAFLEDTGLPERAALASLVAGIIGAVNTTAVHYARDIINPFTRRPMPKPANLAERIAAEDHLLAQIRSAGAAATASLLEFLGSESAHVRGCMASALRHYVDQPVVREALQAAVASETDADARRAMDDALALAESPQQDRS